MALYWPAVHRRHVPRLGIAGQQHGYATARARTVAIVPVAQYGQCLSIYRPSVHRWCSCLGWKLLANTPGVARLVATGTRLYKLHSDNKLFKYTGTPCTGDSCPGWILLDQAHNTVQIAASVGQLFQMRQDKSVWRYTGTPCSGATCRGWQALDKNAATLTIVASQN